MGYKRASEYSMICSVGMQCDWSGHKGGWIVKSFTKKKMNDTGHCTCAVDCNRERLSLQEASSAPLRSVMMPGFVTT